MSLRIFRLDKPFHLFTQKDISTKVNPRRSFSSSEAETEKTEEEVDGEDIGATVVCSCDIHQHHQVKSPGYFSS
ncbi:unnamed protein product [Brassica oleracea]